jgi:hypothetical protein
MMVLVFWTREMGAMEYVIMTDRPFDEIEALTIDALEQLGLVVQRTFSL